MSMNTSFHWPSAPLYVAEQLPLSLLPLNDWALVTISGADRYRYLQGQVTCDVNTLQQDKRLLGAHCDISGRMWSCFQLFELGEQLALLQRRSVCEQQMQALRQYAMFSQVTITHNDNYRLLGIAGQGARQALTALFPQLPTAQMPILALEPDCLLYFPKPTERFLIITVEPNEKISQSLLDQGAQHGAADQWLALDIAAGQPIIDAPNSGHLLPQAVQLDQLQGISFTKGCYIGQEGVARAQYRGAQKRALYWLTGQSPQLPTVGESLELSVGEGRWRSSGRVLASVRLIDETVWIQAVLPAQLAPSTPLRIPNRADSLLTLAT